jgi:hypothetical protein
MKRTLKRTLSLILSLALIMTTGLTAFATEEPVDDFGLTVVESSGVNTATTADDTSEYIVVYDSILNTIQVSIRDIETDDITYSAIADTTVDLSSLITTYSGGHQDTFSNYEYDYTDANPIEWNLERPDSAGTGQVYFKTYQNASTNKAQIDIFYAKVNSLNDKEWDAVQAYGLALITAAAAGFATGGAAATGGILTPAAIAAIVAATGATGNYLSKITAIGTACNECNLAYINVKNASVGNIHY